MGSMSSLGSRFRLVEELTEAGESGRDSGAAPLVWGAMTASEAMVGGRGGGKGGDRKGDQNAESGVEVGIPRGGCSEKAG